MHIVYQPNLFNMLSYVLLLLFVEKFDQMNVKKTQPQP